MFGTLNPYWWAPNLPISTQGDLPRVDVGGIFKLSTNAVALTSTTVDYGINPCLYSRLPSESLILLTIHDDVPSGGESLPVTLVVPTGAFNSTVTSTTNTSGTTKLNIVDSLNTNVTGSNVVGNTLRLAYINKCTGVVRFMEFTNATTVASSSKPKDTSTTDESTNS